jgi:hypothetical protein
MSTRRSHEVTKYLAPTGAAPGRRTTRPSAPPTGRQHATAHHSPADHTSAEPAGLTSGTPRELTGHSEEEITAWDTQAAAEHGEHGETDVEPEELEEGLVLLEPEDEGV